MVVEGRIQIAKKRGPPPEWAAGGCEERGNQENLISDARIQNKRGR
jgi:hypothetical protein